MKLYMPKSYIDEEMVKVLHANGITLCATAGEGFQFDRVIASSILAL